MGLSYHFENSFMILDMTEIDETFTSLLKWESFQLSIIFNNYTFYFLLSADWE